MIIVVALFSALSIFLATLKISLIFLIPVIIGIAIAFSSYRNLTKGLKIKILVIVLVSVGMFLNAHLRYKYYQKTLNKLQTYSNQSVVYSGKVIKTKNDSFKLRVKSIQSPGDSIQQLGFVLNVYKKTHSFIVGDSLVLKGKLKVKDSLQYQNIVYSNYASCYSTSFKVVRKSVFKPLFAFKSEVLKRLRRNMGNYYGDLLAGLLIGINGVNIDQDLYRVFQDLGLLHILIVSGAQVALLTNVVLGFCMFVGFPQKLKLLVVILFNCIFLLFVGGDLSVLRAVVMMQINVLLMHFRRSKSAIDILFLSGFLLVAFQPSFLFHLSFVLSFFATYAVIEVAPRISNFLQSKFGLNVFIENFSISLSPILITSPIILMYFNRFSLLSLFANIVIGPIIEIVVVFGFLAVVLSFIIPIFAKPFYLFVFGLMVIVVKLVQLFVLFPINLVEVSNVFLPNVFVYYLLLFGLIYFSSKIFQYRNFLGFTCFVLIGFNIYFIKNLPKEKIYFYSKNRLHYLLIKGKTHSSLFCFEESNKHSQNIEYILKRSNTNRLDLLYSPEKNTGAVDIATTLVEYSLESDAIYNSQKYQKGLPVLIVEKGNCLVSIGDRKVYIVIKPKTVENKQIKVDIVYALKSLQNSKLKNNSICIFGVKDSNVKHNEGISAIKQLVQVDCFLDRFRVRML